MTGAIQLNAVGGAIFGQFGRKNGHAKLASPVLRWPVFPPRALARTVAKGPPPHALWLWLFREKRRHAGFTAEALLDLVGGPDRPGPCILTLVGVDNAIAIAAQKKIALRPLQLGGRIAQS